MLQVVRACCIEILLSWHTQRSRLASLLCRFFSVGLDHLARFRAGGLTPCLVAGVSSEIAQRFARINAS